MKTYIKQCQYCPNTFETKKYNQMYCSKECSRNSLRNYKRDIASGKRELKPRSKEMKEGIIETCHWTTNISVGLDLSFNRRIKLASQQQIERIVRNCPLVSLGMMRSVRYGSGKFSSRQERQMKEYLADK